MFSFGKKSKELKPPKAMVTSGSLIPVEASWQTERAANSLKRLGQRYPNLWLGFAGVGAGFLILGAQELFAQSEGDKEIAFRKRQLSRTPYELKGDEAQNFPWNKENLNEWLHRPVVITGRPRHSQAMLVPRVVDKYHGYDYIVPLITKENEDGSEEYGILLNKGWMPHEYRHIGARKRIENPLPQTFLAYVSTQSELDYKTEFFKEGNSPKVGRNKWGHVYLPDMAEATGFKNSDKMKYALLEAVEPESTTLDERNPKTYSKNLSEEEDYPYPKTYSGALQLKKMPWENSASQHELFTLGTLSTVFGLALKFVR